MVAEKKIIKEKTSIKGNAELEFWLITYSVVGMKSQLSQFGWHRYPGSRWNFLKNYLAIIFIKISTWGRIIALFEVISGVLGPVDLANDCTGIMQNIKTDAVMKCPREFTFDFGFRPNVSCNQEVYQAVRIFCYFSPAEIVLWNPLLGEQKILPGILGYSSCLI